MISQVIIKKSIFKCKSQWLPIMKDRTKEFNVGEAIHIKSNRYGSIIATVIKYIPNNEWICSFKHPNTGEALTDYFTYDEID